MGGLISLSAFTHFPDDLRQDLAWKLGIVGDGGSAFCHLDKLEPQEIKRVAMVVNQLYLSVQHTIFSIAFEGSKAMSFKKSCITQKAKGDWDVDEQLLAAKFTSRLVLEHVQRVKGAVSALEEELKKVNGYYSQLEQAKYAEFYQLIQSMFNYLICKIYPQTIQELLLVAVCSNLAERKNASRTKSGGEYKKDLGRLIQLLKNMLNEKQFFLYDMCHKEIKSIKMIGKLLLSLIGEEEGLFDEEGKSLLTCIGNVCNILQELQPEEKEYWSLLQDTSHACSIDLPPKRKGLTKSMSCPQLQTKPLTPAIAEQAKKHAKVCSWLEHQVCSLQDEYRKIAVCSNLDSKHYQEMFWVIYNEAKHARGATIHLRLINIKACCHMAKKHVRPLQRVPMDELLRTERQNEEALQQVQLLCEEAKTLMRIKYAEIPSYYKQLCCFKFFQQQAKGKQLMLMVHDMIDKILECLLTKGEKLLYYRSLCAQGASILRSHQNAEKSKDCLKKLNNRMQKTLGEKNSSLLEQRKADATEMQEVETYFTLLLKETTDQSCKSVLEQGRAMIARINREIQCSSIFYLAITKHCDFYVKLQKQPLLPVPMKQRQPAQSNKVERFTGHAPQKQPLLPVPMKRRQIAQSNKVERFGRHFRESVYKIYCVVKHWLDKLFQNLKAVARTTYHCIKLVPSCLFSR